MKISSHTFKANAKKGLEDKHLQKALSGASSRFSEHKRQAFALLSDPEGLRSQAQAIKKRSIDNLDSYLERLEKELVSAGVRVHWAPAAADARKIITDLALRNGVKLIVKGKSMVSEEISLNDYLEQHGLEVVETDLGEFIVQLAGESPSHIVGPALHKTKEQVAELFHQKLGIPLTYDIEKLTAAAREKLREKFLSAQMGITGVNFAVAETGSLAIVTNEGNGRMCSSLPRIHVALMGIEKVIWSLDELAIMLNVLPRSATGQKISTYVTILNGPRKPDEEDGPEELHLVILDNGRSEILAGDFRESLYCLRCGACLNICPVYQKIGGHAYGWVYPGPIGSILTPMYLGLGLASELPQASTLCGACLEVCPVKIDIPRMLLKLRERVVNENMAGWQERIAVKLLSRILNNRFAYEYFFQFLQIMQRPFLKNGLLKKLPYPFDSLLDSDRIFPLASKPFRRMK